MDNSINLEAARQQTEQMKDVQRTVDQLAEVFPLTEGKVLPPDLTGMGPGEAVKALADFHMHSILFAGRMYGGIVPEAHQYARRAWRDALPDPNSKRDTLAMLACIAWGMRRGLLDPNEGKMLCYIAQTCLTVQRMIDDESTPPSPPPASLPLFPAEKPPLEGELIGRPGQNSMEPPTKGGHKRG